MWPVAGVLPTLEGGRINYLEWTVIIVSTEVPDFCIKNTVRRDFVIIRKQSPFCKGFIRAITR